MGKIIIPLEISADAALKHHKLRWSEEVALDVYEVREPGQESQYFIAYVHLRYVYHGAKSSNMYRGTLKHYVSERLARFAHQSKNVHKYRNFKPDLQFILIQDGFARLAKNKHAQFYSAVSEGLPLETMLKNLSESAASPESEELSGIVWSDESEDAHVDAPEDDKNERAQLVESVARLIFMADPMIRHSLREQLIDEYATEMKEKLTVQYNETELEERAYQTYLQDEACRQDAMQNLRQRLSASVQRRAIKRARDTGQAALDARLRELTRQAANDQMLTMYDNAEQMRFKKHAKLALSEIK